MTKKFYIGEYLSERGSESIYIEIRVEVRDRPCTDWDTMREVNGRAELGIMGNIGNLSFGQIQDTLKKMFDAGKVRLAITREDFLILLKIWDEWHLNTLIPGTRGQMKKRAELIQNGCDESAEGYEAMRDAVGVDNGYVYGERWLSKEVPAEVLAFLEEIASVYSAKEVN